MSVRTRALAALGAALLLARPAFADDKPATPPAPTFNAANCMHGVEHYGNMIVYLRMKGLVPPSTEDMQAAAAAAAKPQK